MTIDIPLTRGFVAIVDDETADQILALGKWHAFVNPRSRTTYAARKLPRVGGGRTTVYMHQVVTGWTYVDHANGNGLDNRRANLRPATQTQNNGNAPLRRDNTSGYKGVYLDTRWRGRWQAQIKADGHRIYLGAFDDPMEAARAYDEAAVRYFGEFARLNFPEVSR